MKRMEQTNELIWLNQLRGIRCKKPSIHQKEDSSNYKQRFDIASTIFASIYNLVFDYSSEEFLLLKKKKISIDYLPIPRHEA